jgi:hypothetical protein
MISVSAPCVCTRSVALFGLAALLTGESARLKAALPAMALRASFSSRFFRPAIPAKSQINEDTNPATPTQKRIVPGVIIP